MKNIVKSLLLVVVVLTLTSCNDNSKFVIAKSRVGNLNSKTKIKELGKIFENDSIFKKLSEGPQGEREESEEDQYEIYDKEGKHLLTIIPNEELDSVSTIKSVEIFDERFKTDKGINIKSTFQQINANTIISKIEPSFLSVILYVDDLNATISVDKEQLGLKDLSLDHKISKEQIPDLTEVKSFIVWFN